jgi:hypothetical protein
MTRMAGFAVPLAMVLLLAGCGGDGGQEYDARYAERALARGIMQNDQGRISGVQCIARGENTYKCVGSFEPSLAALEDEYGDFPKEELRIVQERQTGEASFEITVDPEDGSYIYE